MSDKIDHAASGGAPYAYEGNGNLASDGTNSYTYDFENRLVGVSGGRSATLIYDPLGRLFSTSGGAAGVTRFQYDGDALVAEYDASHAVRRRYMHGPGVDEPILWDEGSAMDCSGTRFLHTNAQGSIVATANCNGVPLTISAYDDHGIPQTRTPSGTAITNTDTAQFGRFSYTGQTWIPEAGVYYYKNRVYSPTAGRFLQPDPIGYADGVNLYAYVGGDPVNRTDPTGLACRDVGKVSNPYCDPANPDDDAPLTTVTGQRRAFASIRFPNAFRDQQFGTINGQQDELDRIRERQPGENPNKKFDLLSCVGKVALGGLAGAFNPASVILEVGGAIAGAATRTAPEDASFSSKKGPRLQRDARSAVRIGLRRALSAAVSSPQARIVSGAIGAGLVLFSSESCGIKAIPKPADILPKGF